MTIKEIAFNTKDYRESLTLRCNVLRAPLGKELSALDTADEDVQMHFGVFINGKLKGCVVVKPDEDGIKGKLRQMAIDSASQGQGIGRQLVLHVEGMLKEKGFKTIELSARKTAGTFYQKLGYEATGEFYLEQGIPHIKMKKPI